MSKLILKDKTEIVLSTHYGDTYVTIIDTFAKLDELKDKLTDEVGAIKEIQAVLLFRVMDKLEQVEAALTGRINALSNMLVELMNSDGEGEGNEQ